MAVTVLVLNLSEVAVEQPWLLERCNGLLDCSEMDGFAAAQLKCSHHVTMDTRCLSHYVADASELTPGTISEKWESLLLAAALLDVFLSFSALPDL